MQTAEVGSESFQPDGDHGQPVQQSLFASLVKKLGGGYASALGIDLASMRSDEIFKWFLAALILAAKINENTATRIYKALEKAGALSHETILKIGWRGLVRILDRDDYADYDLETGARLSEVDPKIRTGG